MDSHGKQALCRNSQNWYKLVMSERERRQARIEALRKEKENEELAECTFKPSLHKKDCKGSASVGLFGDLY